MAFSMGQKIIQPTKMINKDAYYVYWGGGKGYKTICIVWIHFCNQEKYKVI